MLSIRLPKAPEARLERLAERTGQPKSHHVRQALIACIDDLEDRCLAEERLEKFDEGPGLPLAGLMKKCGLTC